MSGCQCKLCLKAHLRNFQGKIWPYEIYVLSVAFRIWSLLWCNSRYYHFGHNLTVGPLFIPFFPKEISILMHYLFPIESIPFYPFCFPRPFWPLACQCTWPIEPQTSVNPSIRLLSLALLKKLAVVLSSQVASFLWVFIPAHQFLSVLEVMPRFISLALNSACLLFPQISFPIIFLYAKDFVNKSPSSQGYGFSSGHVWMWELDCEESWVLKNSCFWTVVLEKTLESPLDSEGDQPWDFFGRNDAKA